MTQPTVVDLWSHPADPHCHNWQDSDKERVEYRENWDKSLAGDAQALESLLKKCFEAGYHSAFQ